jgi:hypothetical protein
MSGKQSQRMREAVIAVLDGSTRAQARSKYGVSTAGLFLALKAAGVVLPIGRPKTTKPTAQVG